MPGFKFNNVVIDSWALHLPDEEVTSDQIEDRLADLYKRLNIPFGTLERVSGIKSRRLWRPEVSPSDVATTAGKLALEQSSVDIQKIGLVVNCSVTRDYFEPATACLVHGKLNMPETAMAFDITNACLGFSNGILYAANLIDAGVIEAALLVTGENVARMIENSVNYVINNEDINREELLKLLPTFTLGCGAAAMVLRRGASTEAKKVVGGVARSATQFNQLCNGNGDFYIHQGTDFNPIMYTESSTLINQAAKLGNRMWKDFSEFLGWSKDEVNHIFCHQVGKQVNQAFYDEMGLDMDKEFTTYQRYGNLVSASLPAAFFVGLNEKGIVGGDKILLTAFGSGLNSIFLGIQW